jgi:hypothetical protein
MVSSKVDMNKSERDTTNRSEEKKEKQRNRFINLGKIVNFNFIQKPKKTNASFKSELSNGLFDNVSVQKEVFSYRDFKARKLMLTSQNPSSTV